MQKLKTKSFARYRIWGCKWSITIIFLSDYFKENLTTKLSKKLQNVLFWHPSDPNTSKNEISGELVLSVLKC